MIAAKKIAVIGSNCFSGSHFVNFLIRKTDCEIIGISRSPEYPALFLPYLYKKKRPEQFRFFQLDINNQLEKLIRLLDAEKPEIIVNFAAQGNVQYSWKFPSDWFFTNTVGVMNLALGLAGKEYLEKFVQISTPEIYGFCQKIKENISYYDPSTPYAVSKAAGDMMLRAIRKQYGFPVCFARSTNVYGPHQQLYRIIPRTIIYLKLGRKIPLHGGGLVNRDFISIYDSCRALGKIIQHGRIGGVYHLTSGKMIKISDLVRLICDMMGRDFGNSVEISKERPNQDPEFSLESEAKLELGWQTKIDLPKGIKGVIEWIDGNWEEIMKNPLDYIHKK